MLMPKKFKTNEGCFELKALLSCAILKKKKEVQYIMFADIRKVLVPVDGSDQAHKAFMQAIEIAKASNAQLEVVAVIHDDTVTGKSAYRSGVVFEKLQNEWNEFIKTYEQEAIDQYGLNNINAYTVMGKPKNEIIRIARDNPEIDLIVIGATGKNAIERSVLGSVTQYVVRHAEVPVFVVR